MCERRFVSVSLWKTPPLSSPSLDWSYYGLWEHKAWSRVRKVVYTWLFTVQCWPVHANWFTKRSKTWRSHAPLWTNFNVPCNGINFYQQTYFDCCVLPNSPSTTPSGLLIQSWTVGIAVGFWNAQNVKLILLWHVLLQARSRVQRGTIHSGGKIAS